jgi:hypothetical protein
LKQRSGSSNHRCYDIVRGATKQIYPNLTNAENTEANGLTSFDSDGFTLGNEGGHNQNSQTFASWNWKAGGTAVSNTDGSITSSVSANTDAGFSVVTWTVPSSGSATVGHGIDTPKMIISKSRSNETDWEVHHTSLANTQTIQLNSTNAVGTNNAYNDTDPTSSVFSVTASGFGANRTMVSYCFAEKKGYSKFGSYVGNGNADGTFIYTGFKPAMIIRKILTTGGWLIHDSTRTPFNGLNSNTNGLRPNSSEAEFDFFDIDYLSNGFKLRTSEGNHNTNGTTYIYMAFAENPLVGTNGVPATAR